MTTTNEAEAAAVARIVREHIKHEVVQLEGPDGESSVPVIVRPVGLAIESAKKFIDEWRDEPERRQGTAKLLELDSFIDHVNRFKDADSALFADPNEDDEGSEEPTLTGVLDYHRGGAEGAPRFGKHRALYTFPLSEEWKAWRDKDGDWMDQATFAAFLEERILDVADPGSAFSNSRVFAESLGLASFASPTKLLELSRGLSVHEKAQATNKVDLNTGETTMFFKTEHTDENGAPLTVPRAFIVQIRVFRGGVAYQIPARLRYRVGGGRVSWSYEMHQPERSFDDAFRDACENAREKTSLPLFYGTPEA